MERNHFRDMRIAVAVDERQPEHAHVEPFRLEQEALGGYESIGAPVTLPRRAAAGGRVECSERVIGMDMELSRLAHPTLPILGGPLPGRRLTPADGSGIALQLGPQIGHHCFGLAAALLRSRPRRRCRPKWLPCRNRRLSCFSAAASPLS